MSLTHQNYHRLDQLLDGFDALSLGKILIGNKQELCLVLQQELLSPQKMIIEMGYVKELPTGQLKLDSWVRLHVSQEVERLVPLLQAKNDTVELIVTEHQYSIYLHEWLMNLEHYEYAPKQHHWQLECKPKQGAAYYFAGRMLLTQGVHALLSPSEVKYIHHVLVRTAALNNGIDYLQVIKHPTKNKIFWAIDALSQESLENGEFSSEELEEYHSFTLLLPEEY